MRQLAGQGETLARSQQRLLRIAKVEKRPGQIEQGGYAGILTVQKRVGRVPLTII